MRNRFHALCPYFAMFPESFPAQWVERLSQPGDTVLDPFCGRGTTPFEALMRGRKCIASDVNHVAACLTRAKCSAPTLSTVLQRLRRLQADYDPSRWARQTEGLPEFFGAAFAPDTLAQLLYLRETLDWRKRRSDAMVAALVLGSLHGESSRSDNYLSNQMPRTIATKPAYSVRFWRARGLVAPVRDAFSLLQRMARYRYVSHPPKGEVCVLAEDMRKLPARVGRFPAAPTLVVTSPPYLDVTHYEEDQWLRLWFLGGPPHPIKGRLSRDDRHTNPEDYWGFIADMWRSLGAVVAPGANVVMRLGARSQQPERIVEVLTATSRFSGRPVTLVSQEVSAIKSRQTGSFRPGSRGCLVEVDVHLQFADAR